MLLLKTLDDELSESFTELEISSEQQSSIMNYLSIIRARSEETWGHSVRVGLTGKEIAKFTHIVEPKALYYSGLLHDVGKALTNPTSLDKKEGFNGRDRKELSRHPSDGYRILKGIHDFSARIALMHHSFQGERSYPKSMPREDMCFSNSTHALICYCARLIGLIDFYDAATYRENDRYSPGNPILPTNEEVKTDLIKYNQDQAYLIDSLYDKGIFGRKEEFI